MAEVELISKILLNTNLSITHTNIKILRGVHKNIVNGRTFLFPVDDEIKYINDEHRADVVNYLRDKKVNIYSPVALLHSRTVIDNYMWNYWIHYYTHNIDKPVHLINPDDQFKTQFGDYDVNTLVSKRRSDKELRFEYKSKLFIDDMGLQRYINPSKYAKVPVSPSREVYTPIYAICQMLKKVSPIPVVYPDTAIDLFNLIKRQGLTSIFWSCESYPSEYFIYSPNYELSYELMYRCMRREGNYSLLIIGVMLSIDRILDYQQCGIRRTITLRFLNLIRQTDSLYFGLIFYTTCPFRIHRTRDTLYRLPPLWYNLYSLVPYSYDDLLEMVNFASLSIGTELYAVHELPLDFYIYVHKLFSSDKSLHDFQPILDRHYHFINNLLTSDKNVIISRLHL